MHFIFLGKRAETVRHSLEETFQRARWRQPSVVLLDDLDHVTGAATTAEHEHGPEALLRQHIAQSTNQLISMIWIVYMLYIYTH